MMVLLKVLQKETHGDTLTAAAVQPEACSRVRRRTTQHIKSLPTEQALQTGNIRSLDVKLYPLPTVASELRSGHRLSPPPRQIGRGYRGQPDESQIFAAARCLVTTYEEASLENRKSNFCLATISTIHYDRPAPSAA